MKAPSDSPSKGRSKCSTKSTPDKESLPIEGELWGESVNCKLL